jgi:ABC-type Zn uptake system ZnuABC Zn-binding protein ZnuA
MRTATLLTALLAAAAVAGGCGSPSGGSSGSGVAVVATTTQLADFTRAVGGDRIRLTQILQPNTDPHDYEPRPADVRNTAGARLVLTSGDKLDTWMGDVVKQSGGGATTVDVGATVPYHRAGQSSGPEASKYDPHWWHDPRNAEAAVTAIRDALTRAEPSARSTFAANADRYLAQLRRLDTGIESCMSRVPRGERKLVTDHDAFGYFTQRYGIDVVGAVIPSQTTQAQPNARSVAKLVSQIKRQGVKAIFPESSINPKLAQAIARQTGADASATLYGDTLGPKGSAGETYLAMEHANATAMVDGFTGTKQGCAIAGL